MEVLLYRPSKTFPSNIEIFHDIWCLRTLPDKNIALWHRTLYIRTKNTFFRICNDLLVVNKYIIHRSMGCSAFLKREGWIWNFEYSQTTLHYIHLLLCHIFYMTKISPRGREKLHLHPLPWYKYHNKGRYIGMRVVYLEIKPSSNALVYKFLQNCSQLLWKTSKVSNILCSTYKKYI